MKKVLILGATSNISRYLIPMLLKQKDVDLTLFARNGAKRLGPTYGHQDRIKLVSGNWNNPADLDAVMPGQDLVFMATGHFKQANQNVVQAMEKAGVKRLVVAGGLGIDDEVAGKFGQWNAMMMGDMTAIKEAAAVITNSPLDYTFMRMSWLYDQDGNEKYELIPKGQPFRDAQLTRQAAARFVADVVANPALSSRQSVGLGEPGTHFDKPSFY